MTERSSASAEGKTYELPDEVAAQAQGIIADARKYPDYCTDAEVLDGIMLTIAAHFERAGAEKMREAAAQVTEDFDRRGAFDSGAAIRALPLPAQEA